MDHDSGYWLIRLFLQRGLALMYLTGFLVALNQFRALCGDRGLLPAATFLRLVPFREMPSIFYFLRGDRFYLSFAALGTLLAALAVTGISDAHSTAFSMLVWSLMWVIYLSFVNAGQIFYAFGWESLLLESGFLAVFLGPADTEPSWCVIWLFRWLAFRVMFGAGLIKIRGDECWRDLTCLTYHFETQPMPNPLSRTFHRMPPFVHKTGVALNHVAELILPALFFAPQPVANLAGIGCFLFLLSIMVSGNFAWLNWLTAILCLSALDGSFLAGLFGLAAPVLIPPPQLFQALSFGLVALVAAKSVEPVKNLISKQQIMNTSFDPFHLVNTYGAFGSITRDRYEIVLEGTDAAELSEGTEWRPYEFRGKPGDPFRRPPIIAPYHLRLDWLMWFEAMPSRGYSRWFVHLVVKLLQADRQTLSLLLKNPFPHHPPVYVRARYYCYTFGKDRWWNRELIGDYLPPQSLESDAMKLVLAMFEEE